jgi:hypothetical protein
MPVYLCQPGTGGDDPWRHGLQVYASPFSLEATQANRFVGGGRDLVIANWVPHRNGGNNNDDHESSLWSSPSSRSTTNPPIRRVRHTEVILVDDVCMAYNRYWLRLRWPGHKGGFAGYIAMGLASEIPLSSVQGTIKMKIVNLLSLEGINVPFFIL